MNRTFKIGLVDDHSLLRNGLASLVNNLGYEVSLECGNGKQLVEKWDKNNEPDLILMDISMPEMDGFETTLWLKNNHPLINVLALSMSDDENSIIRMIKNGAKGYILKDTNPNELRQAIESIMSIGFHYSDRVTGTIVRKIKDGDKDDDSSRLFNLNELEIEFLKLVCTELTYKEIAQKMNKSPRTIDGYRDTLFVKLDVKSRVGLVTFAIKNGIVNLN
jgi:two-component system, NarL family, invasion response regulator UvrY